MASDTPTDSPTGSQDNQSDPPEEQAAAEASSYKPGELEDKPKAPPAGGADINLDLVLDVPVNVSLRVGSTDISIRDLVSLVEGSVIALDQDASEPMEVLVNGMLIARGEIVVVDDKFGIRLTDVVSSIERIETLN